MLTPRDVSDQAELRLDRARNSHAAGLLEEGEARVSAGDLEGALARFQQGAGEDLESALLLRRSCEVLTLLGRTERARTACFAALQRSKSNGNTRATVRALVSDPHGVTLEQLELALFVINKQRGRSSEEFTPAAAMCDIAERLKDGIMLERCESDLLRIAPGSTEAQRALATLESRCPPLRFWAGWSAIALAALGTAAHAGKRWRRWPQVRGGGLAASVLVALALLAPRTAGATEQSAEGPKVPVVQGGWLSKWPVDDAHPADHIPAEKDRDADPLEFGYWLQDLALKAEIAKKQGDHPAAARFYAALAKAVPDRAIGWTKLCDELEAAGDREKAAAACGAALLRDGLAVKDYLHYGHLVLAKPGRLDAEETKALDGVLAHLSEEPAGHDAAIDLGCEVGAKTESVPRLEQCTRALAERAPGDPKALVYRWALAMQRGELDQASAFLQQAKDAGLEPTGIARMEEAVASRSSGSRRRLLAALIAGALLVAAAAVWWVRRRRVSLPAMG